MMKKIIKFDGKAKSICTDLLIFLTFMALSYLFVFQVLRTGVINNGDDTWYHVNRILEIREGIKSGNFMPYIYTHSFGQIAYPLGIFYPQVTLIPIALVSLIFKYPVTGIYAGVSMYTLLTLIIMYFVMRKLRISRIASFLGTVLYTFSAYRTVDAFTRFAMGEYIAMTFLPLCFYGFYQIVKEKYKDWPYLALGYIGILLSHVLSAFIVLVVLILIWLLIVFFTKKDVLKQVAYFIYVGILSLCGSLIFLVPFLEQELYQKYSQPSPTSLFATSQNFDKMLLSALNNSVDKNNLGVAYSIGLPLLLVVFIGGVYYKNLKKEIKVTYLFSIIIFMFSSSLFPWFLLQQTPLSVIQYTFRLLIVPTLCLSVVGAIEFDEIIQTSNIKTMFGIITTIVLLLFWSSSMGTLITNDTFRSSPLVYTNNSSFISEINYLDQYTPKKSQKYISEFTNHIADINGKRVKLTVLGKVNEQIYRSKKFKKGVNVELPISNYKNYVAYQGNIRLKISVSKNNRLKVTLLNSKELVVKYRYSLFDKISYIVSIITWLYLVSLMIHRRRLRKE
ncbi:hypothetical protein [Ligilactobacillus equi]